LTAGLYEVTVTDANGLSETISAEVEGILIPIEDENGNLIDCTNDGTCPTLITQDDVIPTGIYQANTAVNSSGVIDNNANVQFKAGTNVILREGFTIPPNTEFSAKIEDCQ